MFKSNNRVIVVVSSVLILIIVVASYFVFFTGSNDKYSVVYLSSGEIYVGKLSYFPSLKLGDAYLLQTIQQKDGSTNFQLVPLSEALWSPEKLYLNREQVLFTAPIVEKSKIMEVIREKGK